MKILTIEGPSKYDIYFKESFADLSESISKVTNSLQKAFIITDSNVAPLYLNEVKDKIAPCFKLVCEHVILAGEKSKTLENAEIIVKKMIEEGFGRDDLIIALGGGVVGDLSGFCAAIYMRGIDFIQIPTTLLSQVDSSIGGKVAVDMDSYKNMIGAFHNPILVYENSSCLYTLDREQFLSGMGEAIKSALLGNINLWQYLLENIKGDDIKKIDSFAMVHVLYDTCCIKKHIVEEDPFDTGKRALLNLGHTFGHAIEKCSDFMISHGACVALGCICASYISKERGYISTEDYREIYEYIKSTGLYVSLPGEISLNKEEVINAFSKDKKNCAKGLNFILLKEKGHAVIKNDLTSDEIERALSVIGIN